MLVVRGLETVLQAVELGFGGEASREKLIHLGPSLFFANKVDSRERGKEVAGSILTLSHLTLVWFSSLFKCLTFSLHRTSL